jgi:two-component system, sensor histidine kinase and response regulator
MRRSKALRMIVFLGLAAAAGLPAWAFPGSDKPAPLRNIFDHLTINDGLSQGTAYCVLQDRRGFLWIGSGDGLHRYDGTRVRIYRPSAAENSLWDKWIRCLFLDSRGMLWVGTPSGLNRYNPETDDFTRFKENRSDETGSQEPDVMSIAEDAKGGLWLATNGRGLNLFSPQTGSFRAYRNNPGDPSTLADNIIYAVLAGRDGMLWLATQGGLDQFDPAAHRFFHFRNDPADAAGLSRPTARTVFEDRQGRIWVGTDEGLNVLDRKTGRFTRYQSNPNIPGSLSHNSVNVVFQDRQGRILIGTLGGLSVFDESTRLFSVIRNNPAEPRSLSYDFVISLFEDRTGILWIGTSGRGLNKIVPDRERFTLYENKPDDPSSLVSNIIRSIAEDGEGRIWIGTEDKGVDRLDRRTGEITHFTYTPGRAGGLNGNHIYTVKFDRQGTAWIGSLDGGINRYDPKSGRFTWLRHSDRDPGSLSSNAVRVMVPDSKGRLWVGTEGGGLNRLDPGKTSFVHYLNNPADPGSLSHNIVRSIFEDRSGRIWIGTFGGGLNRWDPQTDRFVHYRKGGGDRGLCNDIVMTVDEDSHGRIWIGTNDGINRLDPATEIFLCYTEQEGLPNTSIYGLLVDARDMVWVSSNRGLARLDPETRTVKSYDGNDGLQGNEFNGGACFRSKSGEMFFGGPSGLSSFHPDALIDNPNPPAVVLTDFQIYNKPVPVGKPIDGRVILTKTITETRDVRISYRSRMISFEFAALHFASPGKNRFAYRMEGLEDEWNEVGSRNFASYSNLKPGRYAFRVKAANNDGVWNQDGVSLSVQIVPAFWMTWWFRGLALFGLLLGGSMIVQRRVAAARRHAEKLEKKVLVRTAELREEIAVRQRTEAELARRRKYLEAVLFNSSNAIISTDARSAIREWSPGAEKIFGWRREEVLGRNIDDVVIRPDLKADALRLQQDALAGRALDPVEAVRHRRDGTPIDVIVSGSPIVIGEEIGGMVAVYADITQLKRAEAAAREASRAKSEFLANMSHEIRTPMNGIFGMTELALETDLKPDQREYLDAVKTSAEALMTIINDILDFSKIEARKIEMEKIPFRLRDAVHSIVSTVSLAADRKGLELVYSVPPDMPDGVVGDPGRFRQVLTNLLSNAIKFTAQGEVVTALAAEARTESTFMLHVAVRDTGIGIPADKVKLIFEPFTQADSSTTRLFGGTGLGLAISSQLVGLMGGRIWAESESGRGSTFHFTVKLGIQPDMAVEIVPVRYEDMKDLPVLIVDDNATNRRILVEMLTHWGLRPTAVEGAIPGLAALAEARESGHPFRLVLTDAHMPEVDGFELADRIKHDPNDCNLLVMMLSSSGFRGDSARCRELGLTAFLTKPIKQSQLLDAILMALGTSAAPLKSTPLITRHDLSQAHARYDILLTEDNIINQKLAVRILENRGHRVTVAGNGREALEAVKQKNFDAVLMDVQMPVMDGFQATAAIREMEKAGGRRLPIIAMTAHAMADDRAKCLDAGMDDYVSKPLKPMDLLRTIEEVVVRMGRPERKEAPEIG